VGGGGWGLRLGCVAKKRVERVGSCQRIEVEGLEVEGLAAVLSGRNLSHYLQDT